MEAVVLDSTVLIDYTRANQKAHAFLAATRSTSTLATHAVVVAEVLSGARDKTEMREIEETLAPLRMLTPHASDFTTCLALLRQHLLAGGVDWPDCLIAATCLRRGLPIATTNDKHFKAIRGLRVIRPY